MVSAIVSALATNAKQAFNSCFGNCIGNSPELGGARFRFLVGDDVLNAYGNRFGCEASSRQRILTKLPELSAAKYWQPIQAAFYGHIDK